MVHRTREHAIHFLRRRVAAGLLVGAALSIATAATAQQDFSKVEITTVDLGSGLAMLQGAGGNIGVSTGPDGAFLIDDQFAPLTGKIRAAVAKLSSSPIRFVVNTHWHGDHVGGNGHFGAQAPIIAHENVRARMKKGGNQGPARKSELPEITYEDGLKLYINGETVHVRHVANCHTDGDSIVHFEESNVVHLGDLFFSGMLPFVDLNSGGDPRRLQEVIAELTQAGYRVRSDDRTSLPHQYVLVFEANDG